MGSPPSDGTSRAGWRQVILYQADWQKVEREDQTASDAISPAQVALETGWADASGSHRYDPGGGINDVRVQPDHGTLLLTWVGGAPPYEVQQSTNPAWPRTNSGTATAATSLRLTPHGPRRFYRVTGNF